MDNGKIYYRDELILGNENEKDISFENKLKQNKQDIKAKQLNKIDFKMPIDQIEAQNNPERENGNKQNI